VKIQLAFVAIILSAPCAVAQGCFPPEQPYAYEPPANDPDLRAIVRDQYQTYIEESEAYLNCLHPRLAAPR